MPDQIPGAGAAPAADATVVTPPNGGAPADEAGAKPAEKPADSGDQKPKDAPAEGADDGDDDDATGDKFADDNADPAENKRKTAKDFIIQRKTAKIAKLKAKQDAAAAAGKPDGEKLDDDAGDEPDDAEGDEQDDAPEGGLDPEGLKPIVEEHIAAQDAKEVGEFLKDNPDFEPYKAKVERWMKHPSRRHLPVRTIFAEVAMEHIMKIGADRARAADKKAKDTQAGGGSNREATSPIDWRTASREQVEAEQMRVRMGR